MNKELSIYKISKILLKNKNSIFLFSSIICIIAYLYSFTIEEKYSTNIQFFTPENITQEYSNEESSINVYLIESLASDDKDQEKLNSNNVNYKKNFEQIFLRNLYLSSNFRNFIKKKKIKEILKKNDSQIMSNIFSDKFNIEKKFLINKTSNISYYEMKIIHSKYVIKDLELLIPMYVQHVRKLSIIQLLQSKYSKLKHSNKLFSENKRVAKTLDLDKPLYLYLGEKSVGSNFSAQNQFLFYEGAKILEQIIKNNNDDKIMIEKIIAELKIENTYLDQNFIIKSFNGKSVVQNLIHPIRLIYIVTGLLFGFIISIIFILYRRK